MDFGSLISQLLEVVLALVGNQRWQGMLQAQLQPLLHLALGYMQMTAAQVGRGSCLLCQSVSSQSVPSQSAEGTRVNADGGGAGQEGVMPGEPDQIRRQPARQSLLCAQAHVSSSLCPAGGALGRRSQPVCG